MTDDMSLTPDEPAKHSKWRSPKRIAAVAAIALVAVVALAYGGIFFYANVLNDSPDQLDESDLDAALAATTTAADAAPADSAAPGAADPADPAATTVAPADPAATTVAPADPAAGYDGDWVATPESQFGYRVEEVLAGVNTTAVGRSNQLTGTMTVEGTTVPAVDMEVQVATIASDQSQRDNNFRGRVMNTDEFPTATFHLTEPIELGAIPAEGQPVTATATGELTLHGVTQPVTFDVTAQASGGKIGVLGSIPVLFSDYGIQNPSYGTVKTEDDGLIEFVLVFAPA